MVGAQNMDERGTRNPNPGRIAEVPAALQPHTCDLLQFSPKTCRQEGMKQRRVPLTRKLALGFGF